MLRHFLRYLRPNFKDSHYAVCLGFALILHVLFWSLWMLFSAEGRMSSRTLERAFLEVFFASASCVFTSLPVFAVVAGASMMKVNPQKRKLRMATAAVGFASLCLLPFAFRVAGLLAPWLILTAGALPILFLFELILAFRSRSQAQFLPEV